MTISYEFESSDTLITQQEIVDFAPVDPASYADQRRAFIVMREEKIFRACMGIKFYKALMANKVKYGMTGCCWDVVYTNFKEGTTYREDDVVLYKNRLYIALDTTNGTKIPTDESFWKLAPKFADDNYNYLWERYLRTVLAFSISNDSIFYRVVSDTPSGLVQKYEDGKLKAIAIKDVGRLRQEYQSNIDDLMETMHQFLKENKDLYPDYGPFTNDECIDCNIPRKRHYGFNTRKTRTSMR